MQEDGHSEEEPMPRGTSGAEDAQANYSGQVRRERDRQKATAPVRAAQAAGRAKRRV